MILGRPVTGMSESKGQRKGFFRSVHAVWGLLGLAASGMCFTGGGHPPPLIFLPVVLVIWLLGHLFLWSVSRLAAGGFARVEQEGGTPQRWPWALILAALLSGFATAALLLRLLAVVLPFGLGLDLPHLDVMLVWLLHPVVFIGLLLRHSWSRILAAIVILGWAGMLARNTLYLVLRGGHISGLEWLLVLTLEGIAVVWISSLLRSDRVQGFFHSEKRLPGDSG